MSQTIDEKVVEMRFDNSNFETNVKKTIVGLDNLKDKLSAMDYSSKAKGFEQIGASVKNIDMNGLSSGIETVRTKFSALQVMGVTALANITNAAVNAGKNLASSLIDPLVNGGRERAQKIKDAKFQMEGLLGTEEYNKQWSRIDQSINYAVADTAYGYDSAARAASQFLASNVQVGDEMDRSLRAISGVAAMTNSTYDDISNIFTRVAGQGRVMAIDLNSLAARGLNAAAQLGKSMDKSEEEIREMVSQGKISFQDFAAAMDDAFGEHAKKGNETFTGALANMKAAMSRIGAKVWDPLIDNQRDVFNQARLLINDLNNNYLNGPINSLNDKLTTIFKGIVKFFELGGVKNILLGIGDVLSYISSILKPIKEAFSEIFPTKSVETLVEYTKKFKQFTENLKLSDKSASNIKSTFKGLFSVLSVGVTFLTDFVKGLSIFVSNLTGIPGGILGVTGALGNWLTKTSETIKQSKIFSNVIETIVTMLENLTNKIKDFCSHLDIFGGIVNGLKSVFNMISKLGSEIGSALGNALRTGDLESSLNVLNTGLFGGMILAATRFIGEFEQLVKRGRWSLGNVSGTLFQIKESIRAFQVDLRADAIMKIAKAIAVLAAALFVLSLIKPDTLGSSLGAVAVMILELMGALKLLTMFDTNFVGTVKITMLAGVISSLASTLLVLSVALKIMSTININSMLTALLGMTVSLGALIGTIWLLPKEKDVNDSVKAIRKLSTSLLILAVALKIMSTIPWPDILIGLGGMAASLIMMVGVMHTLPSYSSDDKIPSLIKMTFSLVILAGALKLLSTMSWDDIERSLKAIGGTFALLIAFVRFLPKDLIQLNAKINALNMMALGLGFTALALMGLGTMNWDQIKIALTGMGASLAECLIFLTLLPENAVAKTSGFVAFSASLLILAGALKILGSLSLPSLGIALAAVAGAFVIMGVAASVLGPMVPTLLGLAGAMALFGVAIGLFGVGVALTATGIATLAAALAGGTTAIVAGITAIILGVANLAPQLIKIFGDTIASLCNVIITSAPLIATTALVVITEVLKSLVEYAPQIVNSLLDFLIGVLNSLKDKLPELIVAAVEVVGAFLEGIVKALNGLDTKSLLTGVIALGILTALMFALSSIVGLIPSAMIGVLGVGAIVAELALVLAAIGALSQIPGLNWLITEGGYLLENIGTAIGKFIGGIVGGVMSGITNSLPKIATDLSTFMTNLQPFIDGAKNLEPSMLGGIAALVGVILALTAANVIESLTSWLTGGSSLSKFGEDIASFGPSLKEYSDSVSGVDPNAIKASAEAAKALAEMASIVPNEGGIISWFSGENSVSNFASQLPILGIGLKMFSVTTSGINPDNIVAAANAAKALAEMTAIMPNEGGIKSWFTGETSVTKFSSQLPILGVGLKMFSDSIEGVNPENLTAAGAAAKGLADMCANIPNEGGIVAWFTGENNITKFASNLPILGAGLKMFSIVTEGINPENIVAAANATKAITDMCSTIPNEGGMISWFTGDNSMSKFAMDLPILGMGLRMFSTSTEGINSENIIAASNATKALAEMTNSIPNEGGIKSWFAGENSVSKFAMDLPILGMGLRMFSTSTEGINPDNIIAASNATKALAEMTNSIPNEGGIKSWFTGENSVSKFASRLPILGAGLKMFSIVTEGINPENVIAASNSAKTLAEMTNIVPKNTDNIIDFGINLKDFGSRLKEYFTNIKEINIDNINKSVNAIKAIESITNVNSGNIKSLSESIQQIIDAIKNMSKITESSADNFNKTLKKLGENGGKNLLKGFENIESDMKKTGEKTIEKYINGVESKQDSAKKACKTLVSKCVDEIKDKVGNFKDAGRDLVKGFANGIDSNTYLATAKAKAMANAAAAAAKKALDEHSPSKVFYKIGEFGGLGFVNALDDYSSKAYKSGTNMAEYARNGLSNAISSITSLIENGIDDQPTIRPVLDLSDVESGAGYLSSMFSNGPSVSVMANLRSINNGMNSRIQNGSNNDVVSELSKLRKDLSNVKGDTYNVNGITYDDGSNITDAVRTLVRAARIERRV